MNLEDKNLCEELIHHALSTSSEWRADKAETFWRDTRNEEASALLARLASEAGHISDSNFAKLATHWEEEYWTLCLSQATREVGFQSFPASFAKFVDDFVVILEQENARLADLEEVE